MQYWENISTQEQRTIKWGLIVVTALVVLRFIWWPLFERSQRLEEDISNEADLVAWMKPTVESIKKNKDNVKPLDHGAPRLSTIEKSFSQAGLSSFITALSQNANNQIVLEARAIPFGALAQCLENIAKSQGIVPSSLTATREKTGIVNAEIIF